MHSWSMIASILAKLLGQVFTTLGNLVHSLAVTTVKRLKIDTDLGFVIATMHVFCAFVQIHALGLLRLSLKSNKAQLYELLQHHLQLCVQKNCQVNVEDDVIDFLHGTTTSRHCNTETSVCAWQQCSFLFACSEKNQILEHQLTLFRIFPFEENPEDVIIA